MFLLQLKTQGTFQGRIKSKILLILGLNQNRKTRPGWQLVSYHDELAFPILRQKVTSSPEALTLLSNQNEHFIDVHFSIVYWDQTD